MNDHPHKFLSATIWVVGFLLAFYFSEYEWSFYAVVAVACSIEALLVKRLEGRLGHLVVAGLALWTIWHGALPYWYGLAVALVLLGMIHTSFFRRLPRAYAMGWGGTRFRGKASDGREPLEVEE
jgi:hypothetical protein